jgi:hypothetical protein
MNMEINSSFFHLPQNGNVTNFDQNRVEKMTYILTYALKQGSKLNKVTTQISAVIKIGSVYMKIMLTLMS